MLKLDIVDLPENDTLHSETVTYEDAPDTIRLIKFENLPEIPKDTLLLVKLQGEGQLLSMRIDL